MASNTPCDSVLDHRLNLRRNIPLNKVLMLRHQQIPDVFQTDALSDLDLNLLVLVLIFVSCLFFFCCKSVGLRSDVLPTDVYNVRLHTHVSALTFPAAVHFDLG